MNVTTVLGVGEVMAALIGFALAVTGVAWAGQWAAGWRATRAAPRPGLPAGRYQLREDERGLTLTAAPDAPGAPTGPVEIIPPVLPPVPPAVPRHRLADAATGSFHAAAVLARLNAEAEAAPPITRATRRQTASAP